MTYSQFRNEQQTFLSPHGNLKYIDKGQGEAIVLLHGIPTSGWLYRKMIDELSQNYRVIVPDMIGFGSSDSPKGYKLYEPKEHAKRLLTLMQYLKINSWSHVFHDAGGLWTWELLKKAPEKISKLVILNTIIYEDGFNPPIRFKKGFIAQCIMAMYSNGITTNMMLKGLFKTGLLDNAIMSKSDMEGYRKPMLEGKVKAMYHFFTNTCNDLPDYSSVFENLNIPKLLIWGKHDDFLVIDKMKSKVFSNLKLKEENVHLIEAKHFIQEEKPKAINELILNFLAD
ncbi:predicted Hydrolase or acyltransferase (alpha/beta hydrolase superfamily) protein [Flavobacteriales bacterium ALC-1]|nr:predicted Hydrolase or acyltransferase (alpha/beta hydrolase superfamily) protein [Flavobacteriales bacterium ALC-1]